MMPTLTLSPRGVRLMGGLLLLAGVALPGVFLKTWRPPSPPVTRSGALHPEMRRLPPGTFLMGRPASEAGDSADQIQHEVEIKNTFAISVTEITQAQYERVMGRNPSRFSGDAERPVENVSWLDAVTYCNRLSAREGLTPCYHPIAEAGKFAKQEVQWQDGLRCRGYRLPTEAEWEYAARADGRTSYAGSETLDKVAWWDKNSQGTTHPVASKQANAWGLYDFNGNVSEWVWDFDHQLAAGVKTLPRVDPIYPDPMEKTFPDPAGIAQVARGGSWSSNAAGEVRVAHRESFGPNDAPARISRADVGFRVARSCP